jgi:Nucleotidyl transferase AbiEii toxin, Type IV TA system
VTAPTRAAPAGRAYLDLRRKARQDHRPVDELMQLYVLESFLARMAAARFADRFVLKGGVLLAAFGERRPTRDIDLQAQAFDNDPTAILAAITEIAAVSLDDGVVFDTVTATAEVIRDEDRYQGVRVSITASLATARPGFHVDVSVGDPISPAPQTVHLPRILGGELAVRGYPLAMAYAEKIVTAISRAPQAPGGGTSPTCTCSHGITPSMALSSARPSARSPGTATRNSYRSARCSLTTAASARCAGRRGGAGSALTIGYPASSATWLQLSWPLPTRLSLAWLRASPGIQRLACGGSQLRSCLLVV